MFHSHADYQYIAIQHSKLVRDQRIAGAGPPDS